MKPITELPELDDASRNVSRGFSRGGYGSARGGSYSGNRNFEASSKNNMKTFLSILYFARVYFFLRCLLQM